MADRTAPRRSTHHAGSGLMAMAKRRSSSGAGLALLFLACVLVGVTSHLHGLSAAAAAVLAFFLGGAFNVAAERARDDREGVT